MSIEVINTYPKYDSYKESGGDWLGDIPESWKLGRISSYFHERRNKVSDKDYPALSVTKSGIFPQWEHVAKSNDGDNRKLVKKGDFVINSRSDRKGSSGTAKQDGSVSLINIVLQSKEIEPRYSEYLFKSNAFIEEFYRMGHGIVADLWTTRFDNIKNSMMPVPTYEEQTDIANFLDKKTIQLDQAITLKQQQIEKLNDYKQIVIQKAVTKGLNPDAKMKNSGINWLGDIPETWDIKKLKFLTSKIGSGVTPSGGATTYIDDGVPLLRSQNIHFNGISLDNVARISESVHNSMSNSKVKKGDVLLNITGGSLGRCYHNSLDIEMNVNQHVCIVRPNNEVNSVFLNYLLASNIGQQQIWFFQQGGGREGLNFQNLKNFDFPLPSKSEQLVLVKYIDGQIHVTNKAINSQKEQIDRLKEYKTILINQAVTGKIKVS